MITKRLTKYVKSLIKKKYRDIEKCFIVEGEKNVVALLHSNCSIRYLICTPYFQTLYPNLQKDFPLLKIGIVNKKTLQSLGSYKSNEMALAVVEKLLEKPLDLNTKNNILLLDSVRDPGNLGTILRIAHWYGIKKVICSLDTTEIWNPKVVAASMGSILNLEVYYQPLVPIMKKAKHIKLVTTMNGSNIHQLSIKKNTPILIVVGNESNGVSPALIKYANHCITIPSLGKMDSLNVGVATGIVCDNIFRMMR